MVIGFHAFGIHITDLRSLETDHQSLITDHHLDIPIFPNQDHPQETNGAQPDTHLALFPVKVNS
jgi:hypothetical protein